MLKDGCTRVVSSFEVKQGFRTKKTTTLQIRTKNVFSQENVNYVFLSVKKLFQALIVQRSLEKGSVLA